MTLRQKRIAVRGFKHKKMPSHPVGCKGFLHPLPSDPEMYLYCDDCSRQVARVVAEKYGYREEAL